MKEGVAIGLTSRQREIIRIVKENAPITGDQIAEALQLSRPTIRADLALLVMLGHLDAKPKVGYFMGAGRDAAPSVLLKLQELRVSEVMGVPIVIREKSTVHDAVVTLFLENIGSLIVVDEDGQLAGVVSRKDLLKVTLGNPTAASMPISMVMTRHPNIVTVHPEDFVLEAARKMIDRQVDSLPVVVSSSVQEHRKETVEVVGRITKTVMTEILLDLATSE